MNILRHQCVSELLILWEEPFPESHPALGLKKPNQTKQIPKLPTEAKLPDVPMEKTLNLPNDYHIWAELDKAWPLSSMKFWQIFQVAFTDLFIQWLLYFKRQLYFYTILKYSKS